ncbi:OLC1v1022065C1 [Oldenlandia corymbosa var. corymbosa]|uniref:OLC1v1022065C1 n=1 Tax=Oldenlandia corymbosa var. corymbosa TaxID=529605 RepID=A0AAV1BYR1_OLDCO|nr:OLC1v1022065C1 [Oldenlandia corymbosa var. corymbosa]
MVNLRYLVVIWLIVVLCCNDNNTVLAIADSSNDQDSGIQLLSRAARGFADGGDDDLSEFVGLSILNMKQILDASPKVPCYFSFGDSMVDNGNNNNLETLSKANYPPYGVDFPGGVATGRFTNNRNIADFVAQHLGFRNFVPPYATAKGLDILSGVNYGSGSAGIRDETGAVVGDRLSFNRQLTNHAKTVSRLALIFARQKSLKKHLSKCLYTVVFGSNDYLNNYFVPQYYPTSTIYTPEQYADALIQQYSQQLQTLHKLGARKVVLFGLAQLGCTLHEIIAYNSSGCIGSINDAVELFNNRLKPLVDDLNARFPDAKFIYLNSTSIQSGDSSSVGFQVYDKPCCQVDPAIGQCIEGSTPCSDRAKYMNFDNFHPTENVYGAYVNRSFHSVLPTDAYPMDISNLLRS